MIRGERISETVDRLGSRKDTGEGQEKGSLFRCTLRRRGALYTRCLIEESPSVEDWISVMVL